MGFRKIKARVKNCRGEGEDFVLAQFEENYDTWQSSIDELNDADKGGLETAFNGVAEGLGSALVDSKETYLMEKSDLNSVQIKAFVTLLTSEYFELED